MIADIIAEDRNGNPILIAQVKLSVGSFADTEAFVSQFVRLAPPLAFGMFVDLEDMLLFSRESASPEAPVASLKTMEILRHYDPEFAGKESVYGSKMIFRGLVGTLVEAWLRDLAYHWKSEVPPGSDEISRIGLLDHLEGGMTRSDVTIAVSPLR
jgi:hypothetical protein